MKSCIEHQEKTPFFVYDENGAINTLQKIHRLKKESKCNILYSLKPLAIQYVLQRLVPYIDGFSVSSLFEARLSKEVLAISKTVHMATPGIRPDEIDRLGELCDYISFNSVSQWGRFYKTISKKVNCGLRVNPRLSFVKDDRYNPCRKYSKLGVPINKLAEILNSGTTPLRDIKGLHFHTNCESSNFEELFKTVMHIEKQLPWLLDQLDWVNLGGGYLIEGVSNYDLLLEAVAILKEKYGVDVFIEPGKGIVGHAGYIVSSVLDIYGRDGKNIVVLDTTVNHMPEVFEYQYKPDVMQESAKGSYKYILAGATCLAGDLFGEYRFDEPLEIGSRIVFENMGAYTLVKANMFNGVNLPTIYTYTTNGKLELIKQFTYEDYLTHCGVDNYVSA